MNQLMRKALAEELIDTINSSSNLSTLIGCRNYMMRMPKCKSARNMSPQTKLRIKKIRKSRGLLGSLVDLRMRQIDQIPVKVQ